MTDLSNAVFTKYGRTKTLGTKRFIWSATSTGGYLNMLKCIDDLNSKIDAYKKINTNAARQAA